MEELFTPPDGPLELEDKLYVEREADSLLSQSLLRSRATTLVIYGPKHSGKSSLLIRGLHKAKENGFEIALINFRDFDIRSLTSYDIFFYSLSESILDKFQLDIRKANEFYHERRTVLMNLSYLMEGYVIPVVGKPIILALDQADRVVDGCCSTDLFGLIRAWHYSRSNHESWAKVSFVMASSVSPDLFIDKPSQSPFNMAEVIYLKDFNEAQINQLNQRFGAPLQQTDLSQLMNILGGHPYLTRKAFHILNSENMTWKNLVKAALTDQGPFGSHLQNLFQWFQRDAQNLKKAFEEITYHNHCSDQVSLSRLLRAGLVKENSGNVYLRCELYRLYFESKLFTKSSTFGRQEKTSMLTPEQQAAWLILQKAFSLVAGELKQRWQLAREKAKSTEKSKNQVVQPSVSESLQTTLKSQLESMQDDSELRMMIDDLETAIKMTERYNRRRNKYRQQLPTAVDPVPIQIQIEETETERNKAISEIKAIFEKLVNEKITTESTED